MADLETDLFAVLGGAIAGVIGLTAAWYQQHLIARERHLTEHKENLAVVAESLLALRVRIWPPSRDTENFSIAEGLKLDVELMWQNFSLVNYTYVVQSPEGHPRIVAVDGILFDDLFVHFADLHRQIEEIDGLARTDGPRVNRLMYDLFDSIYNAMKGREMTPIYPGEGNMHVNRWHLATATFHVLVGTERTDWPGRYSQVVALHALPDVEKLANELRESNGPSIDEMVKLRDRMVSKIDASLKAIDEVRHRQGLKGRCAYV